MDRITAYFVGGPLDGRVQVVNRPEWDALIRPRSPAPPADAYVPLERVTYKVSFVFALNGRSKMYERPEDPGLAHCHVFRLSDDPLLPDPMALVYGAVSAAITPRETPRTRPFMPSEKRWMDQEVVRGGG